MAQRSIIKYVRPYLDMENQGKGHELNEWDNNHPLNRLRLHLRQINSVLEHVNQLVTELEEERERAIDDMIALHAENRMLRRRLNETGKIAGSVARKSS